MKIIKTIGIVLFVSLSACKTNPTIIDQNLIKYDWVSLVDKYDNIYSLYIEDSLLIDNLTYGIDPVVPYKISFDTLIIYTSKYKPYSKIIQQAFKYKIAKLDSLKLTILQVYPSLGDTLFFNKEVLLKKNDLSIIQLDYFSGICFGGCPIESICIDRDSVLFHYGYRNTKHIGLSKYKLDALEFERLQERLNSIDIENFKLCVTPPGSKNFEFYIKSLNDTIEIDGTFCSNNSDFNKFIQYLGLIERFLPLDSIDNKDINFRYEPKY